MVTHYYWKIQKRPNGTYRVLLNKRTVWEGKGKTKAIQAQNKMIRDINHKAKTGKWANWRKI